MIRRRPSLVFSFIVGLATSRGASASASRAASFSPVRGLGPSLAASVAGGTLVAARGDDGEVVVLFRAPAPRTEAGNLTAAAVLGDPARDAPAHTPWDDDGRGLAFLPSGPVTFPFLTSSNVRVLHAPSGLVVAATGFAPDADHLLNVAAGRVASRLSVFDGGGKSVDPHRLVREELAATLRAATMSDGGRPLGVQLLVIGLSALSRRHTGGGGLDVYTIDPSGGWRSCVGRGTAVGRSAARASAAFARAAHPADAATDAASSGSGTAHGWRGALDRALLAAIEALEQEDDAKYGRTEKGEAGTRYGAVVIFGSARGAARRGGTSRCALVSPAVVAERYDRCHREVTQQTLAP